ncbi:MAG: hypothetical protein HYX68_09860 [Planctomycetes bacterium]|nr:hypothetical protein [Planctomycetota bacterium]
MYAFTSRLRRFASSLFTLAGPTSRPTPPNRRFVPWVEQFEARITPATKIIDNGTVAVVIDIMPTVQENPVDVYYNGNFVGQANVIGGFQKTPGKNSYPQVWAQIANGASRGTYMKSDGTTGPFTTSVVDSFGFQTDDDHFVYPTVTRFDIAFSKNVTTVTATTNLGNFATQTVTTVHPLAKIGQTDWTSTMTFTVNQKIVLNSDVVGNDALRGPTISTMFTGQGYDANVINWKDPYGVLQQTRLNASTNRDDYVFTAAQTLGTYYAATNEPGSPVNVGGPTTQVTIQNAKVTYPGQAAGPLVSNFQAYLADGTISDDTLSIWPELTNVPTTLSVGTVLTMTVKQTAIRPATMTNLLSAPMMIAPTTISQDGMPTIGWSSVFGADHYQLKVIRAGTTAPVINQTALFGNEYAVPTALRQGKYNVYLRTFNSAGKAGPWSAVKTFTVDYPLAAVPVVTSPTANQVVNTLFPTITWNGNAVGFQVRIDDLTSGVNGVVLQKNLTDDSYTVTKPLKANHLYRVQVRSVNEAGEVSAWSNGIRFTVTA